MSAELLHLFHAMVRVADDEGVDDVQGLVYLEGIQLIAQVLAVEQPNDRMWVIRVDLVVVGALRQPPVLLPVLVPDVLHQPGPGEP